MTAAYDTIGVNYADLRKPDARIAQMIWTSLGAAETVLNVGAGAGSYEPPDRSVTAIEPSIEMTRQRKTASARVIQGHAEALPFDANSFDASMAILTVHHWSDTAKGLREMRRVTRGPVVILTCDPVHRDIWLADYIPELVALDEVIMPKMSIYSAYLGPVDTTTVPVPHDCTDGFLYAYWRRPAAYLDPRITAAMSSFWRIDNVAEGLNRLRNDLESGAWADRYSHLLEQDDYDLGYRLVTTK